jgi:hypothetical protein
LGVVEDLGGREQPDVDDGVEEDEIAATHLRRLAVGGRTRDEIEAVEVGATRPVVRHWRVRLRHAKRLQPVLRHRVRSYETLAVPHWLV